MPVTPQRNESWHTLAAGAVIDALGSSWRGLSGSEVARRLKASGPNLLPESAATPLGVIVLRQFASPLIYILLAAALMSLVIGDFKDAAFIAAVLGVNAIIGAWQEFQAENSSLALRKLLRIRAVVERDGEMNEIAAEDLVPGDMLWLESGSRVAADLRLVSTQGVEIDESLLTGESLAVPKNASWLGAPDTVLADRQNMAFAGSLLARGRAKGMVVATGKSTQIGQLAIEMAGSVGGKPPLITRMERFSKQVAFWMLGATLVIGVLGIVLWQYTLKETFFFIVALAVSAIPEGLPVAMTVALAVATGRMARRNVIVRRLAAVEGLGSCTLIASDKTGTLTCNELTVRKVMVAGGSRFEVTGEGFSPHGEVLRSSRPVVVAEEPGLTRLVRAAMLCNEADIHQRNGEWVWHGDAVDVAILWLGQKLGLERPHLIEHYPQAHQVPFEPEHQFAATFHRFGPGLTVFVKGSPERILAMCAGQLADSDRKRLETAALDMAHQGLRIIAVACRELPATDLPEDELTVLKGLELLGFLGMIDPLRPGARQAVADCLAAGVQVAMVTGDHPETALAIAKDLGLAQDGSQVVTASSLAGKSPAALADLTRHVRVFARVTPRQKLEIVESARQAGHLVAVTGDGVNDAPALRAANIGVAMGRSGTDAAREAADLVISDDKFSSIVAGIEEGRVAYDNIRKVIYMSVSTGAAEILLVLLAVLFGLPLPLLAVQLLWLNLVTNGIQDVALAFEPGEGDSLKHAPRPPAEPVFNRLMIERVLVAALVIGGGGFAVFSMALWWGWPVDQARNLLLLTMVLFEIVHIGNCRSETRSAFRRSPLLNPVLFLGSLAAFLLHLAVMYIPALRPLLEAQPVGPGAWALAIAISLLILPAIELHKLTWPRRSLLASQRSPGPAQRTAA
jgi:P-type Ca2+ transporter type 2C